MGGFGSGSGAGSGSSRPNDFESRSETLLFTYRYLLVCRCHICGKTCIFTIDNVHGHLHSHKMTWSSYKALYMSGDPGPVEPSSSPMTPVNFAEETLEGSMEDDDDVMMNLPLQVRYLFLSCLLHGSLQMRIHFVIIKI